jgi:hypothetical protein
MAVHERQNSEVHRTGMKQRGSRAKPEVATISLAPGAGLWINDAAIIGDSDADS